MNRITSMLLVSAGITGAGIIGVSTARAGASGSTPAPANVRALVDIRWPADGRILNSAAVGQMERRTQRDLSESHLFRPPAAQRLDGDGGDGDHEHSDHHGGHEHEHGDHHGDHEHEHGDHHDGGDHEHGDHDHGHEDGGHHGDHGHGHGEHGDHHDNGDGD